jgi:hypothetical protein
MLTKWSDFADINIIPHLVLVVNSSMKNKYTSANDIYDAAGGSGMSDNALHLASPMKCVNRIFIIHIPWHVK